MAVEIQRMFWTSACTVTAKVTRARPCLNRGGLSIRVVNDILLDDLLFKRQIFDPGPE